MPQRDNIRRRIERALQPDPATIVFRDQGATLEVNVFALTGLLLFPEIVVSRLLEPNDLEQFIQRMRSVVLKGT